MSESPIGALLDYYRVLDEKVGAFAHATGLTCTPGCGWCCETANPEITVYEAIPLARLILSVPGLLERYDNPPLEPRPSICFFYDANSAYHCSVYPMRPLICRVFGYAGSRDKFGNPRFAPCRKMVNASSPAVAETTCFPIFQELQYGLLGLCPPEFSELKPFAVALDEAMRRERLLAQLAAAEANSTDDTDSEPPIEPDNPQAPTTPVAA